MKIYDFFIKQIRVKNAKDGFFLLLKLIAVVIIAGEIYDAVRYLYCMLLSKAVAIEYILFGLKPAFFIFILYLLHGPAKRFKKKVGLKNAAIIVAVLSILTILINGSILGFYYINGPYWGKVLDADTGKPIADANVMGEWSFEWIPIPPIAPITSNADARETITDNKGRFFCHQGEGCGYGHLHTFIWTK